MKRLAVIGSFVRDTIHHPGREGLPPLEQWGGIAYSLSAFAAACPRGWYIDPVIRVGADLMSQAREFVASLPSIYPEFALQEASEPTNRVELRYFDASERTEQLTGGVGPWAPSALLPRLSEVDAVFINYISGYEIDLPTAELVRRSVGAPIYADLHSLCLGPPGDGPRQPAPLSDSDRWIRTADWIQVNESELSLIGGIDSVAAGADHLVLLTTRGAAGASFWRFDGTGSPGEEGVVVADIAPEKGDPTGCGDVWGAVTFCGLLDGMPLPLAIRRANAAAAAKLNHPRMVGLSTAIRLAIEDWNARNPRTVRNKSYGED